MANKNREKNINNNGLPVCNINWLITINLNPYEKYCKIRKNSKYHFTCFI